GSWRPAPPDAPLRHLVPRRTRAQAPTSSGRVIPTFRPARFLALARPDWPALARRLGEVADVDTGDYAGYIAALENRRRYFKEHGAVSSDHSHFDAGTEPLPEAEAQRIYAAALRGEATVEEGRAFHRHMMSETARMATEDGLVMTLHPAVYRNH